MKIWNFYNGVYRYEDESNTVSTLPPKVYKLKIDHTGRLYLDYMSDDFTLPSRLYDLNNSFIERVCKTWNKSDNNLGILLSGVKGTSKSVTAKIICNTVKLPVIVVGNRYNNFSNFINEIEEEVIVFIDEFEKVYSQDEDDNMSDILSLLDGISTNKHKKMFIFTSNSTRVDQNLLNRPGRIRYHKEFDRLSDEGIFEIVNDLLIYTEFKEDLLETVGKLTYITVDAVISLINEVNIHREPASELIKDFNLEYDESLFRLTRKKINSDGSTSEEFVIGEFDKSILSHYCFTLGQFDVDDDFYIDGEIIGVIEKVLNRNTAVLREPDDKKENTEEKDKFIITITKTSRNIFKLSSSIF